MAGYWSVDSGHEGVAGYWSVDSGSEGGAGYWGVADTWGVGGYWGVDTGVMASNLSGGGAP